MILSILKNAGIGSITYYVGNEPTHISHLSNCTLICKEEFIGLDNVEQIIVDDPQWFFYKLSQNEKDVYTFSNNYVDGYPKRVGKNCQIHPSVIIGDGVSIGDNVSIGPNTVIYTKTEIGDGTIIDANCTIGSGGMMWIWKDDTKFFLKQLGGVKIGKNCMIGSNSSIVRGSANELTILEDNVNMATGCCIGHGTYIGKETHLANNVATGGSSYIAGYCFIGSSAVISAGIKIEIPDIIIGAGCVVTKSISETGVYVGVPARRVKSIDGKLNGMPMWRN
jgi:UDP-3-O-[3-hydroxymyristoyl] glucosamine N-acyltransferase